MTGPSLTLSMDDKSNYQADSSEAADIREMVWTNISLRQPHNYQIKPSRHQTALEGFLEDVSLLETSSSLSLIESLQDYSRFPVEGPTSSLLAGIRDPRSANVLSGRQKLRKATSVGIDANKAKNGKKSDVKVKVDPQNEADLAHFTHEQRRIMLAQTEIGNGNRKSTYLDIYKFSTPAERIINFIGIIASIISGVIQPLMTVLFGNLTTAFVTYATAIAREESAKAASASLFQNVNKDALFLLYLGIAMFCTTYVYMATW